MKYCPKCGFENANYAKFCVKCGNSFYYDECYNWFESIPIMDAYKETLIQLKNIIQL